MNSGRYILFQVLDLVHWQTHSRLVQRYDAESKVRHFACRQQLICMTFAQLTWWEGFRDIAIYLNARSEVVFFDSNILLIISCLVSFDSMIAKHAIATTIKRIITSNNIDILLPLIELITAATTTIGINIYEVFIHRESNSFVDSRILEADLIDTTTVIPICAITEARRIPLMPKYLVNGIATNIKPNVSSK